MKDKVKLAQIKYYAIKADRYENELHHRVMFDPVGNSQARIYSTLLELSKHDNEVLLDIACGTGNILRTANKLFKKTIGIDISIDMLGVANKANFSLINADSNVIPFKSNSFSVVTCYSSLHHMENWECFFKEVYRVLKPGGYFYTDWDPHGPEVSNSILIDTAKYIINIIRHKGKKLNDIDYVEDIVERYKSYSSGFSAFQLCHLLRSTGFRNAKICFHNDAPCLNEGRITVSDFLYYLIRYLIFLKMPTFHRHELMRYFALYAQKEIYN